MTRRRMEWRPEPESLVEGSDHRGWLSEVSAMERTFVLMLRVWLDGPGGQASLWNALAASEGARRSRALVSSLEGFLALVASGARRKLRRHATRCPCIGEDEARLAAIVGASTRGRAGEARRLAAEIIGEADALLLIEQAARLGQMLDEAGASPATGPEAVVHAAPQRYLH